MRFGKGVTKTYRNAIDTAIDVILDRGNETHRATVHDLTESDITIDFVPLAEINCSGVTGLLNSRSTNKRIDAEELSHREALGEVYIKFADWTYDTAGQRGCQGTLVHEGLHACDFARIISSFSTIEIDPLGMIDMSLYELERRAAIASAEYLVLAGEPDFIDEGLQLGLVSVGTEGKPQVDMRGIEGRMQNGYGLSSTEQGTMISRMLGIRPRGEGFSLVRSLGLK